MAKQMNLKYSEKSSYQKARDERMRNPNKRRHKLLDTLNQLSQQASEMLVIHIAFETRHPFDAHSINPDFDYPRSPSEKPTHFVNAFLGLRKKRPYNKTHFRGLLGYVRKLELEDAHHAMGGFVTLLFDKGKIDQSPYDLGMALVQLLGELSPDKDLSKRGNYRYVFRSNAFIRPPSSSFEYQPQSNPLKELLSAVNFYTHADYYLKVPRQPRTQETKETPALPRLVAYNSGWMTSS
ncbi:MAG: hypothetical protein RI556_12305, partial [Hydrogenovibrio sp.]|uniref:hypothetical protein n=1 Tax=Hydrogenovibrio sp. TaxID=2065821 RepID=UPI0028701BA7